MLLTSVNHLQTYFLIFSFVLALDVSADLTELGRTPVTVISSGVKSILDIGRTLEYLVSYSCYALITLLNI